MESNPPSSSRPLRLPWFDAAMLVAGAPLWWLAVKSREWLIHAPCAKDPTLCSPERIPSFDRIFFGHESGLADGISFWGQNTSGALLLLVPLALNSLRREGRSAIRDIALGLEVTICNGLIGELARITVQRPRPFVFMRPTEEAGDAAHYTSFYSGHTSFSAAAMTMLLLILARREASVGLRIAALVVTVVIVPTTAIGRVFAGRHFPSDTIVGALAGALVAWGVFTLRDRATREPTVK